MFSCRTGRGEQRRLGFVGALALVVLLSAAGVLAVALPADAALPAGMKLLRLPEQGRVADGAGLMAPDQIDQLNAVLQELDAKNGVEIGVATIQSSAPLTPDEYATALFQEWGIGKQGEDNGLLVLIALQERRIKVEVGYGLEGILPDGRVGRLLDDYAMPALKKGEYGAGLVSLTTELAKVAAAEYAPGSGGGAPRAPQARRKPVIAVGGGMAFLLFVLFMLVVQSLSHPPRHVCPKCRGRMTKTGEETIREATALSDGLKRVEYRCPRCGYNRIADLVIPMLIAGVLSSGRRRGPWDGGFGGFGGGGFGGGNSGGGGFGGFGGGSSGGGGGGRNF